MTEHMILCANMNPDCRSCENTLHVCWITKEKTTPNSPGSWGTRHWFDDRSADPSKYPDKYSKTIEIQTTIGWHHIFMGHLSAKWANIRHLFETTKVEKRTKHTFEGPQSWRSLSLIFSGPLGSLQQRHSWSHTELEQKISRLKTRHQIIVARHLTEHQHLIRPTSNQWMFPDNPDTFLETATAARHRKWIASCQKTMKNSPKMAEKEFSRGTANIMTFSTPTNLGGVARMRRWRQDNLFHEACCKKRWKKFQPTSRSDQPLITGYPTHWVDN